MRKANALLFILILFFLFVELFEMNLKILNQRYFELLNSKYLSQFSYIEANVLKQCIDLFYQYKMNDFVIETEMGDVYIYYIEEIAYIKFNFDVPVFAKLEYDLIYNSCINYEIISEALFPIVDKLNS